MVSKELQDKFYAALEALKDAQNGYILEALKAGAKATFENFDSQVSPSQVIGPDAAPKVLTREDILKLRHDPSTEEPEDPEELNFDQVTGKSFPTYDGQFYEKEEYPMVAEAVSKLIKTIDAMKTDDNGALIESIKEGCKVCFIG